MADTYTQAYFHLVFAVKNRRALIQRSWKNELEKYIAGIIQNNGHKLLAIGSMPDHIHIFIGYNVNETIPHLVERIKTSSNYWIRKKALSTFKFSWQRGYGAFTHSHFQIDKIVNYVLNQNVHHRQKSFEKEYVEMLIRSEVSYSSNIYSIFSDMILKRSNITVPRTFIYQKYPLLPRYRIL